MAHIRLLDESIAQKIAAGEVVERPASVIKELVENSIDAGSTFVTVEIKEGGIEHIRVTDNGCGIPADEVELAFLRHATSKIQSIEDLYEIRQMGFRGEALYSIAAVAQLELITKPSSQETGAKLVIHGGNKVSFQEYGCPDGTTIIANNLFYNTPARLKFLNKPSAEAGMVGTVVLRLILANPGVSIKFISNDKVIYHSAGDGNLKNAIYAIFGKDVAKGLMPVEETGGSISISGYLFAPRDAHGNRGHQILMVNRRPVNHFAISGIVERVFSGLTDAKRFPGYVLYVELPPQDVDVNVHPNKMQVRFTNEYQVKQAVEFAVSKAVDRFTSRPVEWAFAKPAAADDLSQEDERVPVLDHLISPVIPPAPDAQETEIIRPAMESAFPASRTAVRESIGETVSRFTESIRTPLSGAGSMDLPPVQTLMQRPSIPNVAPQAEQQVIEQPAIASKPAIRTIGQVFDTYVLLESEDKLLIVDQHAAHERLLYEAYLKRLQAQEPCSQRLLIAQVIQVSYEMQSVLEANIGMLEALGFEIEESGRLSYQIRAVPFILGQPQVQDFIFELMGILSEDRTLRTDELKKEKVMSMACKKAVKAGDRLAGSELERITQIVSSEDTPLTCPHGRPFVIVLDRKSMDRQFRRIK